MAELIWVKPGRGDGRVALFEQHKAHPGGEVFVAGPPVQVAVTPMVERKLKSGDLVKCDAPTPPESERPVRKTKAEIAEEIARARGESGGEVEPEKPDKAKTK
jgi:hypothetical protein